MASTKLPIRASSKDSIRGTIRVSFKGSVRVAVRVSVMHSRRATIKVSFMGSMRVAIRDPFSVLQGLLKGSRGSIKVTYKCCFLCRIHTYIYIYI